MTPETFIEGFADIIEVNAGELTMDTRLDALPVWDSVNVLSYMMLVDEQAGVQVNPDQVGTAQTVGDLYKLAAG